MGCRRRRCRRRHCLWHTQPVASRESCSPYQPPIIVPRACSRVHTPVWLLLVDGSAGTGRWGRADSEPSATFSTSECDIFGDSEDPEASENLFCPYVSLQAVRYENEAS